MRSDDARVSANGAAVIGQSARDGSNRMNITHHSGQATHLREQADDASQVYPELFAYLRQRDQMIHHIQIWIPQPGDPEAYIGIDRLERLLDEMRGLPPGIADLVRK